MPVPVAEMDELEVVRRCALRHPIVAALDEVLELPPKQRVMRVAELVFKAAQTDPELMEAMRAAGLLDRLREEAILRGKSSDEAVACPPIAVLPQ